MGGEEKENEWSTKMDNNSMEERQTKHNLGGTTITHWMSKQMWVND